MLVSGCLAPLLSKMDKVFYKFKIKWVYIVSVITCRLDNSKRGPQIFSSQQFKAGPYFKQIVRIKE